MLRKEGSEVDFLICPDQWGKWRRQVIALNNLWSNKRTVWKSAQDAGRGEKDIFSFSSCVITNNNSSCFTRQPRHWISFPLTFIYCHIYVLFFTCIAFCVWHNCTVRLKECSVLMIFCVVNVQMFPVNISITLDTLLRAMETLIGCVTVILQDEFVQVQCWLICANITMTVSNDISLISQLFF